MRMAVLRSFASIVLLATRAAADFYDVLSPHLLPPDGGCKLWSDVPEMNPCACEIVLGGC